MSAQASSIEVPTKPALVDLLGGEFSPDAPDTPQATTFPEPVGWQILLAMPEINDTTEGGIVKADITKDIEATSTVVGLVLEMGKECYQDKDRFTSGPWCKNGDFVLIGAYKGVRFRIFGKEFRLINDDTVKAVVQDPRGYTRA